MNRTHGEPERVHPAQEAQMTLEERVRDLEMHVNPRWMPPEWRRQQEALGEVFSPEMLEQIRLNVVEHHARTLHALLTGKPSHTADSAPVREALKALGVALGVER